MRYFVFLLGILVFLNSNDTRADEGTWLPFLLQQGIIDTMQTRGMELDVQEIFSSDSASLKDAIVRFGGGCTGSFISKNGLILTNHHCALSSLEKLSKKDRDLVKNGFWSQSTEEELRVPGLSVTLLNNVKNVTDRFERLEDDELTEKKRQRYVDSLSRAIADAHPAGDNQYVSVEGFYFDQQFYLFEYTVFEDVRLVAAPPISIGKFGEDEDNWVWPRHTGDFSIFRAYASPDNEASDYSEMNVPFQPGRYLPISVSGVNENNFVWIYGFPGRTNEYLPSERMRQIQQDILPNRLKIREVKLKAVEEQIKNTQSGNSNSLIARQASLSNVLKKYKGMTEGLKDAHAYDAKLEMEKKLTAWIDSAQNGESYKGLVEEINQTYESYYPSYMAHDYASRVFLGTDLMKLSIRFYHENVRDTTYMNDLKESVEKFTASVNMGSQVELSKTLLKAYYDNIDKDYHPDHFKKIETEFESEPEDYINHIFGESLFTSKEDLNKLMDMWAWRIKRKLKKDPLYQLTYDMGQTYWGKIKPFYRIYNLRTDSLQRAYFNLQQRVLSDKIFYPDANRTIRLAYGQVQGYSPGDAVYYNWHTNVSGITHKWSEGDKAYKKDEKLKQLIDNEDYGTYFTAETPVCFISNTHTTGGNSGSPALNGKGELVGLNFDRNWEGTMADYYFEPSICRNIMVDVRYILFLLEKYGSSEYVLDELTIR